jgi:hypothetical protein
MRRSQQTQLEEHEAELQSTLAKALAPEEIRPGDFVAVLHVVYELPSFLWCVDASTLPVHEPVRLQLVPERGGTPLEVKAVCLPFVLVRLPAGQEQTIDVRQHRLARLDRTFALAACKAHKKGGSKRKGKRRRKRI